MNDVKKQSAITTTIVDGALVLTFAHGEALTLHPRDLNEAVREQAVLHGLKQKLVDAAAISRNTETGRPATITDKYNAVKTVFDRITGPEGQWNANREGGGQTGGLLAQALFRMYDGRRTAEQIKAFLDGKTDAEKTALRRSPKIAEIIETIRAEKVKPANIDTDALLGELDDLGGGNEVDLDTI